eukprot:Platyproteum_vivax@DN2726_c0_g1_i1.p1
MGARIWCVCERLREMLLALKNYYANKPVEIVKKNKNKKFRTPGLAKNFYTNKAEEAHKLCVVVDGSNVAMRMGKGKQFKSQGIVLCVEYFLRSSYQPLVILKDSLLDDDAVNELKRGQKADINQPGITPKMPDDVAALNKLNEQGVTTSNLQILICVGHLITVPDNEYDDKWMIDYAKKKGAVILSNDQYRDCVDMFPNEYQGQRWFKRYVMGFSFVNGEFFRSPNFKWPAELLDRQKPPQERNNRQKP